jgi:hypothetical protein
VTGVTAEALTGAAAPGELDDTALLTADNKLKRSLTTLLTLFCRLAAASGVVPATVATVEGVDAVKGEAVVIGARADVLPVADVAGEFDVPALFAAASKPKRSLTTLLTSVCNLDVGSVVVAAAVVELLVSLVLD